MCISKKSIFTFNPEISFSGNPTQRSLAKIYVVTLASVAQLIGTLSHTLQGVGSIPSQGSGCSFDPRLGVYRRQPIDVSLSYQCVFFFLSLPLSSPSLSKKKIKNQ